MRIIKYFLFIFWVLVSATIFAQTPVSKKPLTHSVLFTQLAQSATVTPMKKAGWYRLTLHNIAANTAWFSDRPVRRHGTLPTVRFVEFWHKGSNSFAHTPPNANLVFLSQAKTGLAETHQHIVKLTQPTLQPAKQTLSYIFETLPPRHKVLAGHTQQVALFIDSADFDFGCVKVEFWKCF